MRKGATRSETGEVGRAILRKTALKTKGQKATTFDERGEERLAGAGAHPSASDGGAKKLRIWDLANATTMRGVRRGGI